MQHLSSICCCWVQTGYSVVSACVVTLRWKDKTASQVSSSTWREGVICLVVVACCGFGAGLFYRVGWPWVSIVAAVFALLAAIALHFRHVSTIIFLALALIIGTKNKFSLFLIFS